jgi:hypothetical protein
MRIGVRLRFMRSGLIRLTRISRLNAPNVGRFQVVMAEDSRQ